MPDVHELIEYSKFPSMPVAWSSEGAGEGWQWGNLIVTMEEHPVIVTKIMAKMLGKPVPPVTLIHHFSVNVFYRSDQSPHGPSIRPIAVASLEQVDVKAIDPESRKLFGDVLEDSAPIMIGLVRSDIRLNRGLFEGPLTRDAVRSVLFEVIAQTLKLSGTPIRIGSMQDVRLLVGPRDNPYSKKNSGCASVFLVGVGGLLGLTLHLAR
jgi:hypothetical protein